MRGKVLLRYDNQTTGGITPAYAGKSHSKRTREKISGDHPRLCGEKFLMESVNFLAEGSPPPMRGKADVVQQAVSCIGITPAYAGKSSAEIITIYRAWDHPRLCGEKFPDNFDICPNPGSPPPMRGKGTGKNRTTAIYRITPAYAGKSVHVTIFRF